MSILNTSWIGGKHSDTIEINTSYSTVSIDDWFFQDEEADRIINEITKIYNSGNYSVLDAIKIWASNNLY